MRRMLGLFSLLFLAGCAAPKPLQLYEGAPKPAAELAHLIVPMTITILEINDRPLDTFRVFVPEEQACDILAGDVSLKLRYDMIWDIDSEEYEVVKSEPITIQFKAEAGKTYRLEHEPAITRDDAHKLAANFSARVVPVP
jgi:hypothetical protein